MLLSATVLYCQAAAAHKQRYHQDKTCGVDGETEVVHFTAAATQEEDDEQYPQPQPQPQPVSVVQVFSLLNNPLNIIVPPFTPRGRFTNYL